MQKNMLEKRNVRFRTHSLEKIGKITFALEIQRN